jgi:hypothetical protein
MIFLRNVYPTNCSVVEGTPSRFVAAMRRKLPELPEDAGTVVIACSGCPAFELGIPREAAMHRAAAWDRRHRCPAQSGAT